MQKTIEGGYVSFSQIRNRGTRKFNSEFESKRFESKKLHSHTGTVPVLNYRK
jgi:hypothetical protein